MKKYKILVVFENGEMRYLGEHLLPGVDPWTEMTKVVKQKGLDDTTISTRGYREDMPYYASISDSTSFCAIAYVE